MHEEIISNLIGQVCEEDPLRDGLIDTPKRVVAAWKHWCGGYNVDISGLLTQFENERYDEMVVVKDIIHTG